MDRDASYVPPELAAEIRELIDEITFAILQDASFAKVIEKAVKNGFEITFRSSIAPVDSRDTLINLKIRKEVDYMWVQQDVCIEPKLIGMVQ